MPRGKYDRSKMKRRGRPPGRPAAVAAEPVTLDLTKVARAEMLIATVVDATEGSTIDSNGKTLVSIARDLLAEFRADNG